jgi:hypothetical protein
MMLTNFLIFAAAAVAPAPTDVLSVAITEPNPKKMSGKEIRDHNAKLARNHPFFIRCVSSVETGSLVKRRASCRTNKQWAATDDAGNREARDIADQMSSKASTNGN